MELHHITIPTIEVRIIEHTKFHEQTVKFVRILCCTVSYMAMIIGIITISLYVNFRMYNKSNPNEQFNHSLENILLFISIGLFSATLFIWISCLILYMKNRLI